MTLYEIFVIYDNTDVYIYMCVFVCVCVLLLLCVFINFITIIYNYYALEEKGLWRYLYGIFTLVTIAKFGVVIELVSEHGLGPLI